MEHFKVIQSKIQTLPELLKLREIWKLKGRKVVFTNGCFDLLHFGHVQYLANAKDLGNILVVGLNSDESIRLLKKGPNRPIQDQNSRSIILASLHVVDAVILFDSETPETLIESLLPDFLVKGGDYTDLKSIVGYDAVTKNGGTVSTIPFAEGFSTSAIEKKIQS